MHDLERARAGTGRMVAIRPGGLLVGADRAC
jgi:hypothetical protein